MTTNSEFKHLWKKTLPQKIETELILETINGENEDWINDPDRCSLCGSRDIAHDDFGTPEEVRCNCCYWGE